MGQMPFNPLIRVHSHGVIGRALSALGGASNTDGAQEMFKVAVAEARRIKLPFIELMLARDMEVAAGRMPATPAGLRRLGAPIAKLVAAPADLDPLLGDGFSAAAALRAAAGGDL